MEAPKSIQPMASNRIAIDIDTGGFTNRLPFGPLRLTRFVYCIVFRRLGPILNKIQPSAQNLNILISRTSFSNSSCRFDAGSPCFIVPIVRRDQCRFHLQMGMFIIQMHFQHNRPLPPSGQRPVYSSHLPHLAETHDKLWRRHVTGSYNDPDQYPLMRPWRLQGKKNLVWENQLSGYAEIRGNPCDETLFDSPMSPRLLAIVPVCDLMPPVSVLPAACIVAACRQNSLRRWEFLNCGQVTCYRVHVASSRWPRTISIWYQIFVCRRRSWRRSFNSHRHRNSSIFQRLQICPSR